MKVDSTCHRHIWLGTQNTVLLTYTLLRHGLFHDPSAPGMLVCHYWYAQNAMLPASHHPRRHAKHHSEWTVMLPAAYVERVHATYSFLFFIAIIVVATLEFFFRHTDQQTVRLNGNQGVGFSLRRLASYIIRHTYYCWMRLVTNCSRRLFRACQTRASYSYVFFATVVIFIMSWSEMPQGCVLRHYYMHAMFALHTHHHLAWILAIYV